MNNLYIQETYVNDEQGHIEYRGDIYESRHNTIGSLFRSLQKSFGKASKMYVDTDSGEAKQVGWVFSGNHYYDDGEKYKRSVWVSVYETAPIAHRFQFGN